MDCKSSSWSSPIFRKASSTRSCRNKRREPTREPSGHALFLLLPHTAPHLLRLKRACCHRNMATQRSTTHLGSSSVIVLWLASETVQLAVRSTRHHSSKNVSGMQAGEVEQILQAQRVSTAFTSRLSLRRIALDLSFYLRPSPPASLRRFFRYSSMQGA